MRAGHPLIVAGVSGRSNGQPVPAIDGMLGLHLFLGTWALVLQDQTKNALQRPVVSLSASDPVSL